MPLALSFVLVPLALHPPTREVLPRSIRSSFPSWIRSHQELTVGFGGRAAALTPYVREATRLALVRGAVRVVGTGLAPGERLRFPRPMTDDLTACLKASAFLGRWLATAGSTASVFVLLGVRP